MDKKRKHHNLVRFCVYYLVPFEKLSVYCISIVYVVMNHRLLSLFVLICLCYSGSVFSQVTAFSNEGGQVICVWNEVTLRKSPGKTAPYVTGVYFGEAVQKTGEEAYAQEERRTYIKVRTSEGVVGWVHEFLFVQGQGMAAVMEPGRIYKRPRTVSTITDQSFVPGDLVVVAGESNGWLHLIGREKKKSGWIEGPDKITNNFRDLEIASLLHDANKKTKPAEREEALETLLTEARAARSPLAQAVEMKLRGQEYRTPLVEASASSRPSDPFPTATQNRYSATPSSDLYAPSSRQRDSQGFQSGYASPVRPSDPISSFAEEADQARRQATYSSQTTHQRPQSYRQSSSSYNNSSYEAARQPSQRQTSVSQGGLISENGKATIINSHRGEPDIFYAYMRDVPVGSKVYVDIPGNNGFIEVRVVGQLPSNSPYNIGLPVACYDALLGNTTERDLSFSYQP